jgi:GNAT superfamily N-acetyltransferase
MLKSGEEYIVRRLRKTELKSEEYLKFIKHFSGQYTDKYIDYAEWIYGKNPFFINRNDLSLYVCFVNNVPIGQTGAMPLDIILKGEKIRGCYGMDFYVQKEYRRKGVGLKIVERAVNDYKIYLTLGQTKGSVELNRKMGWHETNNMMVYKKLINPPFTLLKILLVKSGLKSQENKNYAKTLFRKSYQFGNISFKPIESFLNISYPDGYQDDISRKTTRIIKDLDYLEWRYFNNPFIKYNAYKINHEKYNNVFIIWRIKSTKNCRSALIVDFIYHENLSPIDLKKILNEFSKIASYHGAEIVECTTSNMDFLRALPKGLGVRIQNGPILSYGMKDMSECPFVQIEDWKLSPGDSDVELISCWRFKK